MKTRKRYHSDGTSSAGLVSLDPLMNSLAYQQHDVGDPIGYCKRLGIGYVIGSGTKEADGYRCRGLPPDSYEVIWVPFPEQPLPWGGAPAVYAMLVKLRDVPAPDFVTADLLPHGLYRPHAGGQPLPVEAAGVASLLHGDAVRLRVAPGATGIWSLVVDEREVATAVADDTGWACFDLRPWRGARVRLRWNRGDALPALLAAYGVDFTFPLPG